MTGALCGKIFAKEDPVLPLPDIQVDLLDEHGDTIAQVLTDAQATFQLLALPPGTYRLRLPGFSWTDEVEVASPNSRQITCDRPLFVTFHVSGECTPPSPISIVDPSK